MSVTVISGLQIGIPDKLIGWARRYGPAEVMGTVGALVCALAAANLGANDVAIALAGAWGETAGFYLPMLAREFRDQWRKRRLLLAIWYTLRNLLLEFGAAELLDTAIMRPALIAGAIQYIPQLALGILVSKLVADVVFYSLAMAGRQISEKLERGVH